MTTRDFFPTATASAVNVPQKYGTVTFFIREGKVAHSHDVLGKGDPYVVVRVAGVTKQTVAKMNTKTPRWNEELIFDDIPFSTDEAEIQMWDKDVATKDDFIGSTIYNLTQAKDKKQIEKAFKLLEKNKSAATV